MTGPFASEHYREAERLAEHAAGWMDADWGWKAELSTEERLARRSADLAEAQVHATLALAPAPTAGVILTPAQLSTVLDALADAETYREREGGSRCATCEQAPASADLCAEHSADFDAAQRYHDLTAVLEGGGPGTGPVAYEPARADDEGEGQFRSRMACGDSLWNEEKYPESDAMACPRHGATTAITEERWQADHPPEPYGYILPEDYGRGAVMTAPRPPARRGKCSWCGLAVYVRKNGTAGTHPAHRGHFCLHVCVGTGQPAVVSS